MVRLELIASRCGMWSESRGPSAASADEAGIPATLPALPTVLLEGLLAHINGKYSLHITDEVAPLTYRASSISSLRH